MADAAFRHIASALARLAAGGRLVTITGANVAPDKPAWRDAFIRLQERGRVVFSAAIDGAVYAKHGTTIPTRLTVIDKLPADDPSTFPATPGVAPDVATLLGWIGEHVPPARNCRSSRRRHRRASAPRTRCAGSVIAPTGPPQAPHRWPSRRASSSPMSRRLDAGRRRAPDRRDL